MLNKLSGAILILTLVFGAGAITGSHSISASMRRQNAARYACPMHPEVTSTKPSKCPKCGMALRLLNERTDAGTPESNTSDRDAISSSRIPDVTVRDQAGNQLKFYSDLVKGKTVAINFVFTTCTTICPPLTATFRKVQQDLAERAPDLEVEGEMHGDAALTEEIRLRVFPRSRLKGAANLLIMPTLDAANIAFNLLKTAAGDGVTIGPILLGAARAVHILTPSASVRRIVNMTALTVVDASAPRGPEQSLF